MRKKLLIGLLCIISIRAYSQKQYYGKKEMKDQPKVEFTLEDGSKINGLFVGYNYPNGTYPGFFDKDDIYSFEYKKTESSSSEKIGAKDVKIVKIFDDYGDMVNMIERLDMKFVNKKGVANDKNNRSFQPLIYDGKIQIFGSNIQICVQNSACNYAYSALYLRNKKDDFAIMPIDYDKLSLLNVFSVYDKLVEALRYAGRDCQEFQKYMNLFEAKIKDKSFRKQLNATYKENKKLAIDEGKKNNLTYSETQELLGDKMLAFYIDLYGGVIKEYEKNCP